MAYPQSALFGEPPLLYKYLSYKDHQGYWRINELLSMDQCRATLAALNWKYEVFASVQSYDEYGNVVSAPVFFDLDGDPTQVRKDAQDLVQACEFVVNVTPRIYFSGSKGYHLIIERPIGHPRAHELIRYFAAEVGGHIRSIDPKVYRTRSLLRIPGSPASKKGFYKIEITREELFGKDHDAICDLATEQRFIETKHDPSKIFEDVWQSWLAVAIASLPDYSKTAVLNETAKSMELEFTPCLRTLLETPPVSGGRNSVVFLLTRFFRSVGIDETSTRAIFLAYPHWTSFEAEGREISKVTSSVFKSRSQSILGCKGTSDTAQLMRTVCDPICHFRDDFPKRLFKRV